MAVYCLEMRSTANWADVRYRDYTTSAKKAEAFKAVPKIRFTDSGHHIIPHVREHSGKRLARNHLLQEHVMEGLAKANPAKAGGAVKSKGPLRIGYGHIHKGPPDAVAVDLRSRVFELEVERDTLRDALHTARGAMLGIDTTYSRGVADALAPVLEPALSPSHVEGK